MAARPLWRCPRCGRRFANRNQAHACVRITERDQLRVASPEVAAMYRRLKRMVRRCGPFRVHAAKTRIGFIARMTFAGVYLRRRWLDFHVVLAAPPDDPRFVRWELPGADVFLYRYRAHRPEDLDAGVQRVLCAAYRVGMQEHLAGRGEVH